MRNYYLERVGQMDVIEEIKKDVKKDIANLVFKRKFRWWMTAKDELGNILYEGLIKPGKQGWQAITTTIFGLKAAKAAELFDKLQGTKGVSLDLYDGCGNKLENWLLKDVLEAKCTTMYEDYTDEDLAVEVCIKYKEAEYHPVVYPSVVPLAHPSSSSKGLGNMGMGLLGNPNIVF